MPFMDGYEATMQIREIIENLKIDQPRIVAVTGHTEKSYIKKCYDSGMDDVYSKPLNVLKMKDLLTEFEFEFLSEAQNML